MANERPLIHRGYIELFGIALEYIIHDFRIPDSSIMAIRVPLERADGQVTELAEVIVMRHGMGISRGAVAPWARVPEGIPLELLSKNFTLLEKIMYAQAVSVQPMEGA